MRWLAVVALSLTLAAPAAASMQDPAKDVRPKFRMWWGGLVAGGVHPEIVTQELEAISAAGFGGVEIGFTASAWANDAQRAALQSALSTAKRLGLEIDMTLGASWPFQTPNTKPGSGYSEQELMYGRTNVRGGTTFVGKAPAAIGDREPRGRLVAITAAKVLRGGPAVTEAGKPPKSSTVLDPDSLVDLTPRIGADGNVRWDAPAGDWIVFAFWQRDAEEGVVDHLRAESANKALEFIDQQQIGTANAPLLRGTGGSFFEDSLELDASELFWTGGMLSAFKARRGYDPTRFLPLLFVQGMHKYWVPQSEPTPDFDLPGGEGLRYRHDYYETLTDLYVENHLDEIQRWATKHGMRFRSQVAYGNSFDVTRSARELTRRGGLVDDESLNAGDILPFSPRSRDWRFAFDHYRTLVGGSHQGGSTHVGTELGAVFLQNLMLSLDDYRDLMDKAWAAGITRALIHGFQSQEPNAPWPGNDHFLGLVSESWTPRFPQWRMWKPLADRWARGTMVLERGRPRTDVAIYRDGFVTTAATITGELPEVIDSQFGDLPASLRDVLKEVVAPLGDPRPRPFFDTRGLERAGYSLQYLDPVGVRRGVKRVKARDAVLFPRGPGYRALVIDERWMPAPTAEALDRASKAGLRVVFVGDLPNGANSARNAVAEDARVRRAVARVRARKRTRVVARQDDVAGALRAIGFRPAAEWSEPAPLYTQRRTVGRQDVYYVYNASDEHVRVDASFAGSGGVRELDLWTGEETALGARAARGRVRVPLALAPGGTTVLRFTGRKERRRLAPQVEAEPLAGALRVDDFALHVDEAGPGGTTGHDIARRALGDWRSKPGLLLASGVGTYTASFEAPAGDVVRLSLGRIEGAAQVSVNGTLVTPELSPRRELDITRLLKPGRNQLRVVLATTLKNKALALAPLVALTRPAFAIPGTQPYGLIGPVRLIPFAQARVG